MTKKREERVGISEICVIFVPKLGINGHNVESFVRYYGHFGRGLVLLGTGAAPPVIQKTIVVEKVQKKSNIPSHLVGIKTS